MIDEGGKCTVIHQTNRRNARLQHSGSELRPFPTRLVKHTAASFSKANGEAVCGIAGVFSYGTEAPQVDEAELLRMRDRMRSRGPDANGLWIANDGRVGFAHQRLSIIDLSPAGGQPMVDGESGNQIVFNGEIYNHKALREELASKGLRFQSHSDTEVLLKLYATYGRKMVHRLRGMYAFAIWDATRQGVFLARDPLGIKPLYFSDDGTCLRFASQVKALVAGGRVDTSPDAAGTIGFYLWGSVPEPFTIFRGVRALGAGAELFIERGGKRQHSVYFDLGRELAEAASSLKKKDAEPGKLREAMLDTVRHHLVADVPVGVFLSAGLDSATIAALAKECGAVELETVTLGFEEYKDTPLDEVPLAEEIARHFGTRQHTSWITKKTFLEQSDHLLDEMDQPSIDGINSYFVSWAARQAGLKVALSGVGGDEIFGGYSHFREIPRMVNAAGLTSRVPGLGRTFRYLTAPLFKRLDYPKLAGLIEFGGDYPGAYLLRRGLYMPWELPSFLDLEFVRKGLRELNTTSALKRILAGINSDRLKITALETAWYMRNQLLRDSDWASMAHSVEVRVPFADIELYRAVIKLVASGWAPSKLDMAATPAKCLPDAVLRKKKSGFSIPAAGWAREASMVGRNGHSGIRGWADFIYQKQVARRA